MTSAERRDVALAFMTLGAIFGVGLIGLAWATALGAPRWVWQWAKGGTS